MSQTAPRIAPLQPPYAPEIQQQFDRIMRGAPPLVLFRDEWGVHVATFAGPANLTEEQVRATVLGGASDACWSAAEQALITAVDALHDRATLSDAEFKALSAHYDEAMILEIILLCGFYRTVSYLCNALALPLEEKAARFPSY